MSEQVSVTESVESAHEWEMCVEDELRELQDRVGERVVRRVRANIRRAGIMEALFMPYRRDLVTEEINYEAREGVRDMRRRFVSELREVEAREGLTMHGVGLYLEGEKDILVTRRYTTLIIALLLDLIALHFLLEPGETLIEVGKQMVPIFASVVERNADSIVASGGIFPRAFNSVTTLGSKMEKIVEIVQCLWSAVLSIVALVKIGVLLWFLSKLHKALVRGDVNVQTRQAVEHLVKSLREQLAARQLLQFFKNSSDNPTE